MKAALDFIAPAVATPAPRRVLTGLWFGFRVLRIALTCFNAALAANTVDAGDAGFPKHLRDTGLYASGSMTEVHRANLPFTPQYPLWTDAASKRRWIYLPPGRFIDGSRPDAWQFPVGTKLWKEFALGRRIETRFIERRADGAWHYATYQWNEAGTEAVLAPSQGTSVFGVSAAPQGRFDIPGRADCRACHEGAAAPVLGFSALQLSPDRDPNAPHASQPNPLEVDLRSLVGRGVLRHLPTALLARPPRIAAATPTERAALGYLHGNCGHCHNHNGAPAPVNLRLAQSVGDGEASTGRVRRTLLASTPRIQLHGVPAGLPLVTPGHADSSVLALRMRSRHPHVQMPPLGTRLADDEGLAIVERWISHDLLPTTTPTKESLP